MKKKLGFLSLFVALIVVFSFVKNLEKSSPQITGSQLPSGVSLPEFTLQDLDGKEFNEKSFEGKWTVLYLGFTQCPDACPTTLAYFRGEMPFFSDDELKGIRFLLVSVDPERDTLDVLRKYVKGFHQKIDAARGSTEEVMKLANSLYTTFHKEEQISDNLYMMAHSPRYYLIDPKGKFYAYYEPPLKKGQLAGDLKRLSEKKKAGWFSMI